MPVAEDNTRITITVSKTTLTRIKADAEREQRSAAGQIRYILENHYRDPNATE